jgi:hypothetical protein
MQPTLDIIPKYVTFTTHKKICLADTSVSHHQLIVDSLQYYAHCM